MTKNKIVLYPILFALACILFWTYKIICSKQLISALRKNDLAKAELMLTLGADPDYFYNTSTGSPFKLMSKSRKICNSTWNNTIFGSKAIEKSKLLLKYGADISKGQCSNKPPLWLAVQSSNTAVTALLLQQKNVNTEDENLLHLALKDKQWAQAKVLVEHGADVNAVDKEGYTPLFEALDNFDIFVYLLKKGADPHYQAKFPYGDSTSIIWMTLKPKYEKNFFYLIKNSNVSKFSKTDSWTLLDRSISEDSDNISLFLLKNNVLFLHDSICKGLSYGDIQKLTKTLYYLHGKGLLENCPEFIP